MYGSSLPIVGVSLNKCAFGCVVKGTVKATVNTIVLGMSSFVFKMQMYIDVIAIPKYQTWIPLASVMTSTLPKPA